MSVRLQNSDYYTNDKSIAHFEHEIQHGNNNQFLTLLDLLSNTHTPHPLIVNEPRFCCKLLPLIELEWQNGTITKKLVDTIISIFRKNAVFIRGRVSEDVEIVCRGQKSVLVNKQLLAFSSEYFARRFYSVFSEASSDLIKVDERLYVRVIKWMQTAFKCVFNGISLNSLKALTRKIDFSQEYHKSAIEAMKSFLYTGEYQPIKDIARLKEIYTLSDYFIIKKLQLHTKVQILDRCEHVASCAQLEDINLPNSEGVEESYIQKVSLRSYLQKNAISFKPTLDTKGILLDVTHVELLETPGIVGNLLSLYVKGFIFSNVVHVQNILALPEEMREKISELIFLYNPTMEGITTLGTFFPNVSVVTRKFPKHKNRGISIATLFKLQQVLLKCFKNLKKIHSNCSTLRVTDVKEYEMLGQCTPIGDKKLKGILLSDALQKEADASILTSQFLQHYKVENAEKPEQHIGCRNYRLLYSY